MKNKITKFDINDAFKALEEIEIPTVSKRISQNELIRESLKKTDKFEALFEDYYDVQSGEELEAAQDERSAEVAKAKLARIEKIVDLDAESPEDLQPSYAGKFIIQCPNCMTLFYKDEADIVHSEEDDTVVNVEEKCQHCGNESGYNLIGKVAPVEEDELDSFDAEELPEVGSEEEIPEEEPIEEEPVEETEEPAEEETTEESEEELNLEPVEEDEEEVKEESFEQHTGETLTEEIKEDVCPECGKKICECDRSLVEDTSENANNEDGKTVVINRGKELAKELSDYGFNVHEDDLRVYDYFGSWHGELSFYYEPKHQNKITIQLNDSDFFDAWVSIDSVNDSFDDIWLFMNEPITDKVFNGQVIGDKIKTTIKEFHADKSGKHEYNVYFDDELLGTYLAVSHENASNLAKKDHPDIYKMVRANPHREQVILKSEDEKYYHPWTEEKRYLISITTPEGTTTVIKRCKNPEHYAFKNYKNVSSVTSKVFTKEDEEKYADEIKNGTIKILDEAIENTLTEDINTAELTKKLDEYNDYIKTLQDEIANEEKAVSSAKNEFIKKMHEDNLAALNAALDKAIPEEVKATTAIDELPSGEDLDRDLSKNEELEESLTESKYDAKKALTDFIDSLDEDFETEQKLDEFEQELPESCEHKEEKINESTDVSDEEFRAMLNNPIYYEGFDALKNVDDIDETSLNECISKYFENVYENVNSFEATSCTNNNNTLIIEGNINFKSGNKKNTTFVLEACGNYFKGSNEDVAKDSSYKLNYLIKDNKLITESFEYKYNIDKNLVEGLVK